MALPELPVQGQNPWFTPRNNWDLAVKTDLEGRLGPAGLNASIATGAENVSAVSARNPFTAREDPLPSSGGLVDVPAGSLITDGQIIRPFEPQYRRGRYINVGANPFRVSYGNPDPTNFGRPVVPYPIVNEVPPGSEWFEVNENRPLWAISELGTSIEFFVEMGADSAQ